MVNKGENTMALPTLTVPIYSLKVPSTKASISVRPFLVKEEKILLMAAESENDAEMAEGISQIINNCVQTEDFDVETLTTFDIEYIFLQLRAKSVNEIADIKIYCQNEVKQDDGTMAPCANPVDVKLDLTKIKVKFDKNHNSVIKLEADKGITMRLPTIKELSSLSSGETSISDRMIAMTGCIETIYDIDQVYTRKDFSQDELNEWADTLTEKQFEMIDTFFKTIPALKHDVKYECKKCAHKGTVTLSGIQDFFV
jgi:hypothetical protein